MFNMKSKLQGLFCSLRWPGEIYWLIRLLMLFIYLFLKLAHAWMMSPRRMTIYRLKPLLTWQPVNLPEPLNREGLIYPSVLFQHSSLLIWCDAEKQSQMWLSGVRAFNNARFFSLMWAIFSSGANRVKGPFDRFMRLLLANSGLWRIIMKNVNRLPRCSTCVGYSCKIALHYYQLLHYRKSNV